MDGKGKIVQNVQFSQCLSNVLPIYQVYPNFEQWATRNEVTFHVRCPYGDGNHVNLGKLYIWFGKFMAKS